MLDNELYIMFKYSSNRCRIIGVNTAYKLQGKNLSITLFDEHEPGSKLWVMLVHLQTYVYTN